MDQRDPVYLVDYMQADDWQRIFKDADHDYFFSDGLRGFQTYVISEFVCLQNEDEVLAPKFLKGLTPAMEVTRSSVLNALSSINLLHMYMDRYDEKRQAAVSAAEKISSAQKDDPALVARRKQIADRWLSTELAKIEAKKKELEECAVGATDGAGHQLRRFLQHVEKVGGYSKAFLERLEVWREMDAAQKTARDVIQHRLDEKLQEPRSMEDTFKHIEQMDTLLDLDAAELCGCMQPEANSIPLVLSESNDNGPEEPMHENKNPDLEQLDHKVPEESIQDDSFPESIEDDGYLQESIQDDGYLQESIQDDRLQESLEENSLGAAGSQNSSREDNNLTSELGHKGPEEVIQDDKNLDTSELGHKGPEESIQDDKNLDTSELGHKVPEESIQEDKNPDSSELGHKVPEESIQKETSELGHKGPEEVIQDDKKLDTSELAHKVPEESIQKDKNPDSSELGHELQASEVLVESGAPVEDPYECISDTDSVVALEDSLLEHSLSKLMLKDSVSSYLYLSLSPSPPFSLPR